MDKLHILMRLSDLPKEDTNYEKFISKSKEGVRGETLDSITKSKQIQNLTTSHLIKNARLSFVREIDSLCLMGEIQPHGIAASKFKIPNEGYQLVPRIIDNELYTFDVIKRK